MKPSYHLTAPNDWINDPCAPHYDPATGQFHIYYQFSQSPFWNPPILWGHATSSSIIGPFKDHGVNLSPSKSYDRVSVFTGSGIVQGVSDEIAYKITNDPFISGKNLKVAFYTGVTRLPLHYDLPYVPGSETQNLIWSLDGGYTWNKYHSNPVISQLPQGQDVTGWRDPFIFQDSYIDDLLDQSFNEKKQRYYILLGSGIRNYGGSILMYYSYDLVKWHTMQYPLYARDFRNRGQIDNLRPYGYDEYSFGLNWEVPNLIKISKNDQGPIYLLTFGTEGNALHLRGHHQQAYLLGQIRANFNFQTRQFYLEFIPFRAGLFDHGMLYAVNNVVNASRKKGELIYYGWINEDWEVEDMMTQETSGVMGLPRLVTLIKAQDGNYDISVKPVKDVKNLRSWRDMVSIKNMLLTTSFNSRSQIFGPYIPPPLLPPDHSGEQNSTKFDGYYYPVKNVKYQSQMEIDFKFSLQGYAHQDPDFLIGIVIHHSQPFKPQTSKFLSHPWGDYTIVYYIPFQKKVSVSRWKSSSKYASANNYSNWAFIPQNIAGSKETLDLRIFVDNSVLEVFVNNQIALSTRIYPQYSKDPADIKRGETYLGIILQNKNDDIQAVVKAAKVWYQIGYQADNAESDQQKLDNNWIEILSHSKYYLAFLLLSCILFFIFLR